MLALSAQAAQPEPEPEIYRAFGVSPFWNVRIGAGRMTFETPGRARLNVEAPPLQQTELGVAYWTPDFSVSLHFVGCTDALTGRTYADEVQVRIGETVFMGCGGRSTSANIRPAYSAGGNEPLWWVEIADGRITYQRDERVIIVAEPASRSMRNGSLRVYETPQLSVAIRREACEDDAGRAYGDSVTVTAGRQTVRGCGGRVVREAPAG